MEKENPQRARARPTLALLSQMIVRFLWMESSFANDGRSDVALQRSNRENVAWLGTTCAGRSHVTNFTRAMNAHTDLVKLPNNSSFTLEAVTFEICCGSAGLSDALRRLGFHVYPVDHSANRHFPKDKVFVLDVSNSDQLVLLEAMLHHCKPCHVHLGLPCGTCSRAKEKPMPSKLGGHMGPQPLRSAEHLRGFPHLTGADKTKVDLANKLYNSAIRILHICMVLGCLVSIENPARSWLWALLAVLVKDTNDQLFISWFASLESTYFDACAHGSLRDKRTKLLATQGVFTSLAADCPPKHVHASWQPYKSDQGVIFPTAAEAEYSSTLCKRMADCVLEASA